ncbi:hypothetical protein ABT168_12530 [Streptomyces sp. NPDC001793]|uniref:hypothetical protein n=1 Tax=Streptomyces sp. NPDC001793 TaxID=3154657 RepID=UPI00331EE10F
MLSACRVAAPVLDERLPRHRRTHPGPLNHAWRDYGPRVGIWRLIESLDRHRIRASVMLNSDVGERCPQIIEAGRSRDRAWIAHGKDNSRFQTDMPPDEERAHLAEVVDKYLDKALEYIAQHPGVWLATSDGIAEHHARATAGQPARQHGIARYGGTPPSYRAPSHATRRCLHRPSGASD